LHKGLVRDFSSFQNLSHPETALSAGFCNKSLVRSFYFFSKSPVTGRCTDTLQRNVTKAWCPHFSFSQLYLYALPAKGNPNRPVSATEASFAVLFFPKMLDIAGTLSESYNDL
jgi:hypothetical protein